MRKTVLTFGLISGGILSLMMLSTVPFADQIGFDKGVIIGYTTMVLSFLLVFFGIRSSLQRKYRSRRDYIWPGVSRWHPHHHHFLSLLRGDLGEQR